MLRRELLPRHLDESVDDMIADLQACDAVVVADGRDEADRRDVARFEVGIEVREEETHMRGELLLQLRELEHHGLEQPVGH